MNEAFRQALLTGCECLTAWADLLDRINVFPIADGDTGRNLVTSLSPLRCPGRNIGALKKDLLLSARGNSGNIAAAFFQAFIEGDTRETLHSAICKGRDRARQAVPDPRPGTMLNFFDALADLFHDPQSFQNHPECLHRLQNTVRFTVNQQPKLQQAGVVDAGALGMYLFFEGFLSAYADPALIMSPVTETFGDLVRISSSYRDEPENGYCVDTILKTGADSDQVEALLASLGESVVVAQEENCLKVHFHTDNREASRTRLSPFGEILGWEEDDLYRQTLAFNRPRKRGPIHIMTDAAGSLTREEAKDRDITLLDSYITIGDQSLPETYVKPEALYKAMRSGIRVSTSQASVFERHQHYANVMGTYERVLYLCVGSAYTGNHQIAMDWKKDHDPDNRLTIIDTGAASGRLAVIALTAAAVAEKAHGEQDVVAFARNAVHLAEEYIFLDRLAYLAAGGRLSKTGAFFGDMLGMKPVVTPMADGAKKAGLCRNREEQAAFALEALSKSIDPGKKALIMFEYSDDPVWVEGFADQVKTIYAQARIIVHPLSLTSGAHMGPGTWAVAFLPDFPE
ncbi:MAG: DegV family EDD domain-containing protein [Syntrophales bacterium]|nr:DegV family EDD domain-containing protein [Syntrophales bacterium]